MELTTLIPQPLLPTLGEGEQSYCRAGTILPMPEKWADMIDDEIWRDKKFDHLQITT
jgi:hypothetical protein